MKLTKGITLNRTYDYYLVIMFAVCPNHSYGQMILICLFSGAMKRIEENFREKPLTSKDARKFMRFFFGGACECEVDKQGRILIPANLREYAQIDKDVVSVGVYSRIEIWNKDNYSDNSEYDNMDEIAENMADLGILI